MVAREICNPKKIHNIDGSDGNLQNEGGNLQPPNEEDNIQSQPTIKIDQTTSFNNQAITSQTTMNSQTFEKVHNNDDSDDEQNNPIANLSYNDLCPCDVRERKDLFENQNPVSSFSKQLTIPKHILTEKFTEGYETLDIVLDSATQTLIQQLYHIAMCVGIFGLGWYFSFASYQISNFADLNCRNLALSF